MMIFSPYSDTDKEEILFYHYTIDFPHGEARASRAALVSGGSYFHDSGFSHTDREATIQATIDPGQAEQLNAYMIDRTDVTFASDLGGYKARIKSLDLTKPEAVIVLYILEELGQYQDIIYPPALAGANWATYFDDTYWQPKGASPISWSGSAWTYSGSDAVLTLEPISTWATGFRPTKGRVTFTGSGISAFQIVADVPIYSSIPTTAVEFGLAGGDNGDIIEFEFETMDPATSLNVSLIEFFGVPV